MLTNSVPMDRPILQPIGGPTSRPICPPIYPASDRPHPLTVLVWAVGLLVATSASAQEPGTRSPRGPESWERAIQSFEASDRESPPAGGGIVFTGSSSARGWDVEKWFPDLEVLNRGFGGSTVVDVNYYFERIVTRYQPRVIVFYSGDNDVARGLSVESINNDYRTFLANAKRATPNARVILVAVKPSLARWKLWDTMLAVNQQLAAMAAGDPAVDFLDVSRVMLTTKGQPDPDIFVTDGLHMNEEGYRRWSELLRPLLDVAPDPPLADTQDR